MLHADDSAPAGVTKQHCQQFEKYVQRHYLSMPPEKIDTYFKGWSKRTDMLVKNEGGAIPR